MIMIKLYIIEHGVRSISMLYLIYNYIYSLKGKKGNEFN